MKEEGGEGERRERGRREGEMDGEMEGRLKGVGGGRGVGGKAELTEVHLWRGRLFKSLILRRRSFCVVT